MKVLSHDVMYQKTLYDYCSDFLREATENRRDFSPTAHGECSGCYWWFDLGRARSTGSDERQPGASRDPSPPPLPPPH
eukprot:7406537-Pyramimonas_sp.AAC.1